MSIDYNEKQKINAPVVVEYIAVTIEPANGRLLDNAVGLAKSLCLQLCHKLIVNWFAVPVERQVAVVTGAFELLFEEPLFEVCSEIHKS